MHCKMGLALSRLRERLNERVCQASQAMCNGPIWGIMADDAIEISTRSLFQKRITTHGNLEKLKMSRAAPIAFFAIADCRPSSTTNRFSTHRKSERRTRADGRLEPELWFSSCRFRPSADITAFNAELPLRRRRACCGGTYRHGIRAE